MFIIFDLKKDCQQFCDKVHTFLQNKCKGYAATSWDVPRETKDGKFFTQLPQEYEYTKEIYKNSVKVKSDCKAEYDKGVTQLTMNNE